MQVDYQDLRERVCQELYGVRSSEALEQDDKERLEDCILDGLQMFYSPQTVIPTVTHRWSFLRVSRHVVTASGVDIYGMPEDFGGFDGALRFSEEDDSGYGVVVKVSDSMMATYRSGNIESSGVPQVFCERPRATNGMSAQTWEIALWPTPDGEYTLLGIDNVQPNKLTAIRGIPYGGQEHSRTIRLACLAAAEMLDGPPGKYMQQFQTALAGSINIDQQQHVPETLGYNGRGGYNRIGYHRSRGPITIE